MKTDPKNNNASRALSHPELTATDTNPTNLHRKLGITPGKWEILEDIDKRLVYGERFVADCEFGDLPADDPYAKEQFANARLIAAAPQLYDTLVVIEKILGDLPEEAWSEMDGEARDLVDNLLGRVWASLDQVEGGCDAR
jgi:hypothetical protein